MDENIKNVKNPKDKKHIFWLKDFRILYTDNNYLDFIPSKDMSRVQQLNSIMRFCIYFLILLLLFGKSEQWYFLPIILIVFDIFLYYVYVNDESGKAKDQQKILNRRLVPNNLISKSNEEATVKLLSGYYDSENVLRMGERSKVPVYNTNVPKPLYTFDEYQDFKKNNCRASTKSNPYMNPLNTDFGHGEIPVPCNEGDENMDEEIRNNFNDNLYMDVDNVFEKENSQRQFFSIAGPTVPPDTQGFAEWLYKTGETCKENNEKCLTNLHEDLRFSSIR